MRVQRVTLYKGSVSECVWTRNLYFDFLFCENLPFHFFFDWKCNHSPKLHATRSIGFIRSQTSITRSGFADLHRLSIHMSCASLYSHTLRLSNQQASVGRVIYPWVEAIFNIPVKMILNLMYGNVVFGHLIQNGIYI